MDINKANQVVVQGPTVIDTLYYSDGFPQEEWEQLMARSNYLSQIEEEDKSKLIFIEGDEDAGKTTLVAQFARKHRKSTISVFFNPLNDLDYHLDYFCTNVVLQISHILKVEIPEENQSLISTEQYRKSLYHFSKYLKKERGKINLIIDGLEDKNIEKSNFITSLFDIIPFGQDLFKIIICGKRSEFLDAHPKLRREESKSVILSGFSDDEAIKYLKLEDTPENFIGELFKITKGYPGRLKTLKRIINTEGYSFAQISKHTTYNNWLELDCESVDLTIPEINVIMSLLCLSAYSYSIEDISKITSLPNDKVKNIVNEITILEVSDRFVYIVSSAHKKYMANIVRGNKPKVDELLIVFYANSDSINSLLELPKLYSDKGEWPKVIELLNDQYASKVLEKTGSILVVNQTLSLGLQAAEKINKSSDILRYSLQGSIVNELENYLFWESEIEARLSIEDFIGAITLAESAILLVDRLRLLALIARRQKQLTDKVDEVLANLIQELYNQIDLSSVGNKIYDIVTYLIYAIPTLAIEIIEKSSGKVSDKNINSWVMSKLSIAAIDSNNGNDGSVNNQKLKAIESLNPTAFKQVHQAFSFLVGNYNSEKVLIEVNKLSDHEERLKLLRLWITNNKSEIEKIELVINAALDELIASTSETSITIELLNELSTQLSLIRDHQARLNLYKRFKRIENDLSDLGKARDKFTYQLNMFQTEFKIFGDTAIFSLNKILNEIDSTADILIQLESFAEAFNKLTIMDIRQLKPKIDFIYAKIISLSDSLFATTASQYKISEIFLATIAVRNPRLSLLIINRINNMVYRDEGRMLALNAYLENEVKYLSTDIFHEFEKSFESIHAKGKFYLFVLEKYADAPTLSYSLILKLMFYYEKINSLPSAKDRITGFTFFYKIIIKDPEWKKKKGIKVQGQIYNNWKNLGADWERIDEGFRLCFALSKDDNIFAKKIFYESEELKKSSWLDSQLVAFTYLNSIQLVIRAYNGLLNSGSYTQSDFRIIQDLIARIPSQSEALRLWTEIGFFAYKANRDDVFKKVLNDHILIIIHDLISSNENIEYVLPVLTLIHISDPVLSMKYISKLDWQISDRAYESICYFYTTKKNPFDYYEANIHKYTANFSDLSKAVEVLSHIATDVTIYYLLSHISKAIYADRDLSRTQLRTLLSDLQNIVNTRFPDPRNIKHEGYKIVSELKLAKIDKYITKPPAYWEKFITDAEKISNLSDTILIQSIILEDLPFEKITNGLAEKKKLFEKVTVGLKALPAHYEFVQRVIDISETMYHVDPTTWKKFVEEAFDLSKNLNGGADTYNSQRSIIDSMYRIDPTFAKQLIKRMDNENHETKINKLLVKHYQSLEVADKIKKNKTLIQKEKENAKSIVTSIFLALQALNSEKIGPKKISDITPYLSLGNKLSLHEVFPVYMYFMNNCAKTYRSSTDKDIIGIHRDNFKEAVNSTNLIQLLSQRKKVSEKAYRQFFIDEEFTSNKPIKPKSRDETFSFIRSWMEDNVEEFLIIADPFFEKEDLELLKMVKELNVKVDIDILGSKDYSLPDAEQKYKNYWRSISDEDAPFAIINFCRTEGSPEPPFHDRWIITKNSGLRIGTSVNSVGKRKDSEISVMKPNEALKIREDTLNEYITRRKREFNNEKLFYNGFSL